MSALIFLLLLQFGETAIYDLEIESGEPGEAGEETRQIKPALLYDAHDGNLMNTLKRLQY